MCSCHLAIVQCHRVAVDRTVATLLLLCVTVQSTDSPVWRQVLVHHLRHSNPELVQQATAALQAARVVQ